jgi:hypothetical protein
MLSRKRPHTRRNVTDSARRVRVHLLRSGQALLDIERRTTRPCWDGQTPPHDRRRCPATGLRRMWQTNVALQQTHCMLHLRSAQLRPGALRRPARPVCTLQVSGGQARLVLQILLALFHLQFVARLILCAYQAIWSPPLFSLLVEVAFGVQDSALDMAAVGSCRAQRPGLLSGICEKTA